MDCGKFSLCVGIIVSVVVWLFIHYGMFELVKWDTKKGGAIVTGIITTPLPIITTVVLVSGYCAQKFCSNFCNLG